MVNPAEWYATQRARLAFVNNLGCSSPITTSASGSFSLKFLLRTGYHEFDLARNSTDPVQRTYRPNSPQVFWLP